MTTALQPLLLDISVESASVADERKGRYTAERFQRMFPEAYTLIKVKISAGRSDRQIIAEFQENFGRGVHHHTIEAIRAREFTPEQVRQFRADAMGRAAQQAVDIFADSLDQAYTAANGIIDPTERASAFARLANTSAVAAGIFNQNAEAMKGHATHIVANTQVVEDHNFLANLRAEALRLSQQAQEQSAKFLPPSEVTVSPAPTKEPTP